MGRAPNRRDLGFSPGPKPAVGAAGSVQSRRKPSPNHHKRALSSPVSATADKVTGLGISSPSPSKPKPKPRELAGKITAGRDFDEATGVVPKPAKSIVPLDHAQTKGLLALESPGPAATVAGKTTAADMAGVDSSSLGSRNGIPLQNIADTSDTKRHAPCRSVAVVDSLIYGHDIDDNSTSDHRDFSGSHGVPTSAAENSGLFGMQASPLKGIGLRSDADKVIYGRDIDVTDAQGDPRDFEGAAGNRSETSDLSGIFAPKNDKITFEDIPHAQFAAPGLRKLDAMGSRAEEIIYCRPENPEDTDHTDKEYYSGAAGETSVAADRRMANELLAHKVKLKSGTSTADKLMFGRDLDNSEADDEMQARLYSGAGNPTYAEGGFNPYDASTRTMDKLTDSQAYGCNTVVGTDYDGDQVNDPRDFSEMAGNKTVYSSERIMSTYDITKREAKTVGSTLVNPSTADELIFGGRNIDQSVEDPRDWDRAAGKGARLNLRNPKDISTNPPRRQRNDLEQRDDSGVDELIYGHDIGGDRSQVRKDRSLVDKLVDEITVTGKQHKKIDELREREKNGLGKVNLVAERSFDLLNGEHSSLAEDVIRSRPAFQASAGMATNDLDELKVEDHKRAKEICRDMVPDPNVPPGLRQIVPSRKAEYARLHASKADKLMYNQEDQPIDVANELYAGMAGLTSDTIGKLNMGDIVHAEEWGLAHVDVNETRAGAAGVMGSVKELTEKTRRMEVSNRREDTAGQIFDHTKKYAPDHNRPDPRKDAGSIAARANFRHNSQSSRVGSVVFGKEVQRVVKKADASGFELSGLEGSFLRGTVSGDIVDPRFNDAAGITSEDKYTDLRYKLDDKPARPRIHMMSDVDEVVFGHDVDASGDYPARTWDGAGKESKKLVEDKLNCRLRDVGRRENSGMVDETVFGHDADASMALMTAQQQHTFDGAAGAMSTAILSKQHLNDPQSRMHYPVENFKHSRTGNEETVDLVVFQHDMDGTGTADPNQHGKGSSGKGSNELNARKIGMQKKLKVPVYDQNRSEVDEILYGVDLDPKSYTEADIEALQHNSAGKSSVTKELEVRSESKKIVPASQGHVLSVLFPGTTELRGQQIEREGNAKFDSFLAEEGALGNSSRHFGTLQHRDVEYIDNQTTRKARGRQKSQNLDGAAGKIIPKERTPMQSKARNSSPARAASPSSPAARGYGKPSGVAAHSASSGVASALGRPASQVGSASPKTPSQSTGAPDAYERALSQGREMLESPYTGGSPASRQGSIVMQQKSRTGTWSPGMGASDAAGGYRRSPAQLVSKPRPEAKYGAPPPFGVDNLSSGSTNSRFTTSASFVGSQKRDQIMPYAVAAPPARSAPSSTALVAAGQRPKVPNTGPMLGTR